jgi:hypothetical protein
VTRSALVMCGRTPIPRFCIAMTYGLEAAVPVAEELLLRMLLSVGSVYGMTIPHARAPPIKKTPNRK